MFEFIMEETFTLWRQDDMGNIFCIESNLKKEIAQNLCKELEEKVHKQTYWVEKTQIDNTNHQ